ncbi:transposase [Thermus scotoductus]|uniref:transposase n=1 Tax=Thermus scotoductus TaxID=37636 RepID=UPI001C12AB1F|nr:transposase [Thermus scotoductus]
MRLNEYGEIVRAEWFKTVQLRPYVVLHEDEFVVMPNHIHGMIWIVDDVGATRRVAPTKTNPPAGPAPGSIGAIVGAFKSAVTRRINQRRGTPGVRVWQRNYYEHIIRHERALNAIRRYIAENPLRWHLDRRLGKDYEYHPEVTEAWMYLGMIRLLVKRLARAA